MQAEPITGIDQVRRIVQALEADIVLGRLMPRERLVEQSLAKRFGTNRSLVRAALAELERLNLVVRRPSVGASVINLEPDQVMQLYEARLAVEVAAVHAIRTPVGADVIALLGAIQDNHSAAIEGGDGEAVFRSNIRFHRALFAQCGNPYLLELINDLASRSYAVRSYSHTDPAILGAAACCHRRMIDALAGGDLTALEALVREHHRPSRDAYVRAYRMRFGQRDDVLDTKP